MVGWIRAWFNNVNELCRASVEDLSRFKEKKLVFLQTHFLIVDITTFLEEKLRQSILAETLSFIL